MQSKNISHRCHSHTWMTLSYRSLADWRKRGVQKIAIKRVLVVMTHAWTEGMSADIGLRYCSMGIFRLPNKEGVSRESK